VFVATTNDINDVLPAVQGRFTYKLEIKHSQDQLITLMARTILKQLDWPYEEEDLARLVKRNRGNVREIYNDMDMEFRP
jgi:AAA+ superfamily predicted ATPase